MSNYYEQIRLACIKVNPSILDLKMGCEISDWGYETTDERERYYYFTPPEINQEGTEVWNVLARYIPTEEEKQKGEEEYTSTELFDIRPKKGEFMKIIGRPITLSDVLMVLDDETRVEDIVMETTGQFLKKSAKDGNYYCCETINGDVIWFPEFDLSLSVENQPIETLKFICENLPASELSK